MNGNPHRKTLTRDPRLAFAADQLPDLADATIAILGCGSVGSFAAWNLASAGAGHLVLADVDHLSSDNVRRHVCDLSDVGSAKTDSLAQALQSRFPRLEISIHNHCLLNHADRLHKLLASCEAALVAIDAEGPKYVVNDVQWYLRRPAVYAGVYGGGWGAEFILVDPARGTACYGCAANALGRMGISDARTNERPAYAFSRDMILARTDVDCEDQSAAVDDPWMQARLTSIMPVAAVAADLVTAALHANRQSGRMLADFMQGGTCAWRLAIRHVPAWRIGPWSMQRVVVRGDTACPQRCAPATEAA